MVLPDGRNPRVGGQSQRIPALGGSLRSSWRNLKDSCRVGKRGRQKTGSSSSWWTRQVHFLEERGSISSSNFSLIADTMSCHEERAGEGGESSAGVAEGRSEGIFRESSGSEASDLEGALEVMDASSSMLFPSSSPSGAWLWESDREGERLSGGEGGTGLDNRRDPYKGPLGPQKESMSAGEGSPYGI